MLLPDAPVPRRAALGAGAAVLTGLLTGCRVAGRDVRVQPLAGDPTPTAAPLTQDELARRRAATACAQVLASTDVAAAAGIPAAAAVLAALHDAAQQQLQALGGAGTATGTPGATAPSTAATTAATTQAETAPTPVAVEALAVALSSAGGRRWLTSWG